jgi:hypothetical protein
MHLVKLTGCLREPIHKDMAEIGVYRRVWRMLGQAGCMLQTVLGFPCAPESLESLAK